MGVSDYEIITSLTSNVGRVMMIPPRMTCGNKKYMFHGDHLGFKDIQDGH
jgi:hypothetical protein